MLSGQIPVSDEATVVKEPDEVQRRAVDLLSRREARTVRQIVDMVKGESVLPEGAESADALPVAATGAPPVFHQSAVAGLQGYVEPESLDAIPSSLFRLPMPTHCWRTWPISPPIP